MKKIKISQKMREIVSAIITIIFDLLFAGWLIYFFIQLLSGSLSYAPWIFY